MAQCLHHVALCPSDLDASLRFYCDGIGPGVVRDQHSDGEWPLLFDAPSTVLHADYLGDPARPDSGIVELVVFDRDAAARLQ